MEKIWLKHYPKTIPAEINPAAYDSVVDVFSKSCQLYLGRPAFINLGKTLSYADLDRLSRDFAGYLQKIGLKKGDRIALQMPNCLQYPVALFGALRAGLIVVNTNPLYTPREMEYQFNDAEVTALVIMANFAKNMESVWPKTKIKTVIVTELGDLCGFPKAQIVNFVVKHVKKLVPAFDLPAAVSFNATLKEGASHGFVPVKVGPDDIAFLQYTGGTTGVSKGAMLTHRNMVANMEQIAAWMSPLLSIGTEMVVTALPLYHIFSLTVNCLSFMKVGSANLLITNPRDIKDMVKVLKTHPWTAITAVNTLFNALMHNEEFRNLDFSRLKVAVGGGMAVQSAVAEKWQALTGKPLVEGYGLTETSPVLCCNPIDGTERVGTIGIPVPSTEVKIIDESGRECAIGEPGEICGRGPQVMKGYWKRDDETAKVMDGEWFKTGDIAVASADGFFKIVDRKKDMILVSGFNVYPNEVEDVVAKMPGVLECAAIGVADERSGEVVKIVVVKKDPDCGIPG